MVVPVILYGSSILRKKTSAVTEDDNICNLTGLRTDTLRNSEGIGLAAPQVNIGKNAFAIDTTPLISQDITIEKFSGVFINPEILEFSEDIVNYNEGCLSLPGIFENVSRPEKILVRYQDNNLFTHENELDGICARVFQHEYDHLEGILFIDRINFLRRKLLYSKLNNIKRLQKRNKLKQ